MTLSSELKTSYQKFCVEQIQDLHPTEVLIPTGLGDFYTELLANLDLPITAVYMVDVPACGAESDNALSDGARVLPTIESCDACRVVYLERNPNIPDYAWLLADAKHLVTFSDSNDGGEMFDAAISRGLDITNLYISSLLNMASVHPAHGDTARALETAGI